MLLALTISKKSEKSEKRALTPVLAVRFSETYPEAPTKLKCQAIHSPKANWSPASPVQVLSQNSLDYHILMTLGHLN